MNHRIGRTVFAMLVGVLAATFAYRWVSDPQPRLERERQEAVVVQSRELLNAVLATEALEIVDPLAPDRKVGKAYVYRNDAGWEVSGYYRRDDADRWHPYLMSLDDSISITKLKLSDQALLDRPANPDFLEVLP